MGGNSNQWMEITPFDVDGDGDLDLLRAPDGANHVMWQENTGGGDFREEQILIEGTFDRVLVVKPHDIDEDGLEDLFFMEYNGHALHWAQNLGEGNFGQPQTITAFLSNPLDFAFADFDGDEQTDVFICDHSNNRIVSFPFNGTEFVPVETEHFTISTPQIPEFIDADSDGDLDLLLINNQSISLHLNDGEGGFEEPLLVPTSSSSARHIEVMDYDGDGFIEVLYEKSDYLRRAVLDSAGWQSDWLFHQSGMVGFDLTIEDDGQWTVLATNNVDYNIKKFTSYNLDDWEQAVFAEADFGSLNFINSGFDLDGSGTNDILISQQSESQGWMIREGNPDNPAERINGNRAWGFVEVETLNVDADSISEVLVCHNSGNSDFGLVLFDMQDNGLWDHGTFITRSIRPDDMDFADVSGNGFSDILICDEASDRIAWIENNGDGTFSTVRTISFNIDQPRQAKWVDWDQDDDMDVLAVSSVDKQLICYLNNGNNQFLDSEIIVDSNHSGGPYSSTALYSLDVGNIDGDAFPDAIIGGNEYSLVISHSAEQIEYSAIGIYNVSPVRASQAYRCLLQDVNGDGLDDALVQPYSEVMSIFWNNGGQIEDSSGEYLSSLNPSVLSSWRTGRSWDSEWIDIDANGKGDLLVSKRECNDAQDGVWASSYSNGEFTDFKKLTPTIPGSNNSSADTWSFATGNFNGDDLPDIVAIMYDYEFGVFTALNVADQAGCTDGLAVNFVEGASIDDGSCLYEGAACNDGLAATYNDQIDAGGNCVGQSFEGDNLLRINCGYTTSAVLDAEGNEWQVEQYAVGGGNTYGGGVSGTADDHIMKYIRYNTTGYDLPVPEGGNYLVRLHFAAMRNEVQTEGFEVFHVLLEGDTMESHFDIYEEAGGRQKYIAREYFVESTDDVISLRLPVVAFSNEISGIEVFQYTGDCEDLDLDDVCDDLEIFGCTEAEACNFDDDATEDDGTCEFVSCAGCTDVLACNFDPEASYLDASCVYAEVGYDCDGVCLADLDGDGVCDDFEIEGCTYPGASNYSSIATDDDGSCLFDGAPLNQGCTYPEACNFDPSAAFDDGSCEYPLLGRDCDGLCLNDQDGDGICDEFEGCTIPTACNYNAAALDNDGCCIFAEDGADCDGNCINDIDEDGICDEAELPGCTDPLACNYSQLATDDNGTCFFAADGQDCDGNCLSDLDGDGVCDGDEIEGCADDAACNYDPSVTNPDGSCTYPDFYYDCNGNCLTDADGDGVCDVLEVPGCTYAGASNFSSSATNDDGSCVFGSDGTAGCFYSAACNYNPAATVDDGSCIFPSEGLDCNGECLLDCDGDGICDDNEIPGCTDETACNYLPGATDDLANCEYLSCAGCMEEGACNYDASAPFEDGSCEYLTCAGCTTSDACNYDATATIADGSCEFDSCTGCTYPEADNYDPTATIDDGSCITTGQLQAVADTAYTNGYDDGVAVTELECEEEVTDAYNEGFLQGTMFGGDGTGGGPTESACGPGTVWNELYQLCLPEEVCTGDLTGDGAISVQDILTLLPLFGSYCN